MHSEFLPVREASPLPESLSLILSPVHEGNPVAPPVADVTLESPLVAQLMQMLGCEEDRVVDEVMGLIVDSLPPSPSPTDVPSADGRAEERFESPSKVAAEDLNPGWESSTFTQSN